MNLTKFNYLNLKYHLQFKIALAESYIKGLSPYNFHELVSYDMNPQPLQDLEIDNINILRMLTYEYMHYLPPKGLCTIITSIITEDLQGLLERENACITIGKIKCKENGNLFNVPNKKMVLNRMIEQVLSNQPPGIGGNIHVWITLSDGTIIDPTIDITLDNKNPITFNSNNIICGSPKEIYKKHGYKYIPYLVTSYTFTDTATYKKLDKIEKLDYARNNIINNINLLNNNKIEDGKYFS